LIDALLIVAAYPLTRCYAPLGHQPE